MNVRRIIIPLVLALALSCAPRDRYITISGFAQGGTYTVKINLNGNDGMIAVSPEEIRDSIDSILGRIDNSLSGYNRKSLLSRFNAGETVCPDSIFIEMYEKAYDIYTVTGGVVDAASAPLFDIWGFGFRNGDFPDEETISSVLSVSGMGRLRSDIRSAAGADGCLSPEELLLDREGALPMLNYNALAQGYSCDLVAEYLYSIGVKDMMVDIGEIFCDGFNPSGRPWTLGLDRPVDGNDAPGADMQGIFRVPDGPCGVVTSGNYRKFYLKDGKKYAHTIDPRTGLPVTHNLLSATVVAADALTADAYATYCMVVGLEAACSLLESSPDMEGCLVYEADGVLNTWCSDGFVLESTSRQ